MRTSSKLKGYHSWITTGRLVWVYFWMRAQLCKAVYSLAGLWHSLAGVKR